MKKTILSKDKEVIEILSTCEPSFAETKKTWSIVDYMGDSLRKSVKASFNWVKALKAKNISDGDWIEMNSRAGEWVTCACGNQCNIIPRTVWGVPYDSTLERLGLEFFHTIQEKNSTAALSVLEQIEIRSAQLIEEIKSQK